jgi:hypothetical protein
MFLPVFFSVVFKNIKKTPRFITTYINKYISDARIPSYVPVAKPINKNPIWFIDAKAINFLKLFSTNALKHPHIIENMAENQIINDQILYKSAKTYDSSLIKKPKVAILIGRTKRAVTGLGLPSYTSGAQSWHGNAASLNKKPKIIK